MSSIRMDKCASSENSDQTMTIPDPLSNRIKHLEDKYAALLEEKILELESTTTRIKEENLSDPQVHQKRVESQPTDERHAERLDESGPPKRIRFRERRPDDSGILIENDVAEIKPPSIKEESQPDVGLIWLREFGRDNKYKCSKVDIRGEELRCLLQVQLAHYPDLHFPDPGNGIVESIDMVSPFEPLLHNWQRLDSVAKWNEESDAVKSLKRKIQDADAAHVTQPYGLLANEDKLQRALGDLTLLMDQVKRSSDMKDYFKEQAVHEKSGLVSFKWLWTIFRPGELVYSTVFMDRPQIFIVSRSVSLEDEDDGDYMSDSKDDAPGWTLVCWTYDWDGESFKRVPVGFNFRSFQGTKPIKALEAHPLEFHEYDQSHESGSKEALKKLLIQRGQTFEKLCIRKPHESQVQFQGNVYVHWHGFNEPSDIVDRFDQVGGLRFYGNLRGLRLKRAKVPKIQKTSGRVILDTVSFMKYASQGLPSPSMGSSQLYLQTLECRCAACASNSSLGHNQKKHFDGVQKLHDDLQFILCPPRVVGYVLNKRIWAELDICEDGSFLDVEDGKKRKNFEALQLKDGVKDLIEGLVRGHTKKGGAMVEDFIKEKGQGLVVLLHGPPGTGKTSTAECVAELTGNPLLSVTIADIGELAEMVEKHLQDIFDLAARWKAVLLIDEADVFLESRSSTNTGLGRSSFVSVLLRVLEYYEGILILTTNRITKLDTAVQSRVHLGVEYTRLEASQKQKIFNNLINEIDDDKIESKRKLEEWFKADKDEYMQGLDGRQIRNILISAASLSKASGKRLNVEHVRMMAQSMSKFESSIHSIVESAARSHEVWRGPR